MLPAKLPQSDSSPFLLCRCLKFSLVFKRLAWVIVKRLLSTARKKLDVQPPNLAELIAMFRIRPRRL
jgi:hypothetical protein